MGLSSVSFQVHHPAGGTDMGGGLMLNTVEGVAAFPGSAHMAAQGIIGGIAVSFGIIQTENTMYLNGPIGDSWHIVPPGTLPFDFVGMNASVATALANATEIAASGGDSSGGQPAFLLTGRIMSDDLISLVPGATLGLPLSIKIWVTQGEGLPVKVLFSGSLITSDSSAMVRQLDLYDFDVPVSVTAPI
jgi:hypothetical protein